LIGTTVRSISGFGWVIHIAGFSAFAKSKVYSRAGKGSKAPLKRENTGGIQWVPALKIEIRKKTLAYIPEAE